MLNTAFLLALADSVLVFHLGIILFNLFGLVVIPLGAWRDWKFVRYLWWRAAHLGILAVVALQALFERACFLTIWHDDLVRLTGGRPSYAPLIATFIAHLIFWPLSAWVFTALYLAVSAYTAALWWLVPPIWPTGLARLIPRHWRGIAS
jgi:uncharacterized protein DUF2784